MFSKIYRYFWSLNHRQSCIQAASRRLNASGDSHEICFLSSWTIWLLPLIFSLNMKTKAMKDRLLMHQSILALPIPPPGQPPGICTFFSLSWQFPGVGQEKRGNAPPPGKKRWQMPGPRAHWLIYRMYFRPPNFHNIISFLVWKLQQSSQLLNMKNVLVGSVPSG
jgi:hypothetical protein